MAEGIRTRPIQGGIRTRPVGGAGQISRDGGPGWSIGQAGPSPSPLEGHPRGSKENPLWEQHPEIGAGTRALIMNLSGSDPAVGKRHLEKSGFEVNDLGGFNYGIRKPGETKWRMLEKPTAEWQDITDIGGGTVSTVLSGLAGAGAALATAPSAALTAGVPVLPAAAAVGAAGATGAAVETGLMGIGKLFGLDPSLGEVGSSALTEGITQGAGELGSQAVIRPVMAAVRGTGRGLARPAAAYERVTQAGAREALERESAELAQGKAELTLEGGDLARRRAAISGEAAPALNALMRAKLGLKDVEAPFKAGLGREADELAQGRARIGAKIQPPIATESRALAELRAAQLRRLQERAAETAEEEILVATRKAALQKELTEEVAGAPGAEKPTGPLPSTSRGSNVLEELGALSRGGRVTGDWAHDVARTFNADTLKKIPRLRKIYQKHFGETFAPDFGSLAMKSRAENVGARMGEDPTKWIPQLVEAGKDIAEFVLTSDEAALLNETSRAAVKRALKGAPDKEAADAIYQIVESIARKKKLPGYLTSAYMAYKEAQVPASFARAERAAAESGFKRKGVEIGERELQGTPEIAAALNTVRWAETAAGSAKIRRADEYGILRGLLADLGERRGANAERVLAIGERVLALDPRAAGRQRGIERVGRIVTGGLLGLSHGPIGATVGAGIGAATEGTPIRTLANLLARLGKGVETVGSAGKKLPPRLSLGLRHAAGTVPTYEASRRLRR